GSAEAWLHAAVVMRSRNRTRKRHPPTWRTGAEGIAMAKHKKQRMTEAEWLACRDGVAMANDEPERFTERKARLLMLACCRRRKQAFVHSMLHEAVEALAVHYSDPTGTDRPLDGKNFRSLYTRIDEYTGTDLADSELWVASAVKVAIKPLEMAAADNQ